MRITVKSHKRKGRMVKSHSRKTSLAYKVKARAKSFAPSSSKPLHALSDEISDSYGTPKNKIQAAKRLLINEQLDNGGSSKHNPDSGTYMKGASHVKKLRKAKKAPEGWAISAEKGKRFTRLKK